MSDDSHHSRKDFRNNYAESVTRSLIEVLRWQTQRIRQRLPPAPLLAIPQIDADLKFIAGNARAGAAMQPAATWIGHASMLVQASGLNVLTDPIFSRRASPVQFLGPARAQAPGLRLADLPRIDVVLISHNHYDHLDRRSIRALAEQPGGPPLFLVPLGVKGWLREMGITRAEELDWWDCRVHAGTGAGAGADAVGGGAVEFHFTPAQHWSGRGLHDRNRTLWGAWSVFGEDFHWFFSGDTGYSQDFTDTRRRFADRQTAALGGGFDLALIAVGACLPRWFMQPQHVNPLEAVQIHLDLGAKRSIGVHWGTFALADDPLDHALRAVPEALSAKGVSEEQFFLLPVGGTRRLPRRESRR